METITNYLETMFANLPNTPEVQRTKNELGQMMEDKYNELVNNGVSDNEAVGTVISEFGNLDEIAGELGIHKIVEGNDTVGRRIVTPEEAKQYLSDAGKHALRIALGVAFCILSVEGPIFCDAADLPDAAGVCAMMLLIASAIVLFVYSSVMMQKWGHLESESCAIDFQTTSYVRDELERSRPAYALRLTIGCVLCIISFVPAVIIEEVDIRSHIVDMDDMGAAFLFLFVAVGVFLLILAGKTKQSYETLLQLNNTAGNNRMVSGKKTVPEYITLEAAAIMSVYWPTITSIYLIWSFLTFDWFVTWIIWPIAGIVSAVLNSNLRKI